MSLNPCPNNFTGCPEPFADDHHIYKLAEADTPLKRIYANLGSNVLNGCRCIHKEIEAEGLWLPYPENCVMIDIINEALNDGQTFLSETKRKRLGL